MDEWLERLLALKKYLSFESVLIHTYNCWSPWQFCKGEAKTIIYLTAIKPGKHIDIGQLFKSDGIFSTTILYYIEFKILASRSNNNLGWFTQSRCWNGFINFYVSGKFPLFAFLSKSHAAFSYTKTSRSMYAVIL